MAEVDFAISIKAGEPREDARCSQQTTAMKYYLPDEICLHNTKEDCWVSIHSSVFNLTPLIQDRIDHWNTNMEYLLAFAGKDLSHFFEPNFLPRTEISPSNGAPRVLFPPILEIGVSKNLTASNKLWSQDPVYYIGRITRRPRRIRIINTLTTNTQLMTVCDEDTLYIIRENYQKIYNGHEGSYLWRKYSRGGKCHGELEMDLTLDENGLIDPPCMLPLPPPSIWLYYMDDITTA